jgi:hypothetical protein
MLPGRVSAHDSREDRGRANVDGSPHDRAGPRCGIGALCQSNTGKREATPPKVIVIPSRPRHHLLATGDGGVPAPPEDVLTHGHPNDRADELLPWNFMPPLVAAGVSVANPTDLSDSFLNKRPLSA